MDKEISHILVPQEKLSWEGKINRKVLSIYFVLTIIMIIIASLTFFSTQSTVTLISEDNNRSISGAFIGSLFLLVSFSIALVGFLSNYVKSYALTDKRVIIKYGLIGTDFNSIYFTEIKSVNVNVGLIGKIFSVGTINIDTGKVGTVASGSGENRQTRIQTSYDKLLLIDTPYEVYKLFQTALTQRQESLYSGRADKESLTEKSKI